MTTDPFTIVDGIAPDETPTEEETNDNGSDNGGFVGEFPDSTPEAPYGYFPDGRIRKRRPRGSGSSSVSTSTGVRSSSNERTAGTAAAILARMNSMIGLGLMAFGMPLTATAIESANSDFEAMAKEALVNDPALARRIMSAGTSSGKAQLLIAYAMLAGAVGPSAFTEIRAARAANVVEGEYDEH